MHDDVLILGGGVTGIAASIASGFPVYEAATVPGGICSTYYMRPESAERRFERSEDEEDFRFEVGGGHWLFSGYHEVYECFSLFSPLKKYSRRSSVYLPELKRFIPFPIQYSLSYLPDELADAALSEILGAHVASEPVTLHEWLLANFGKTLCDLFFHPFHERYTAELLHRIAPGDAYKSPLNAQAVKDGRKGMTSPSGYNAQFVYPDRGLGNVMQAMAFEANVFYSMRVIRIDPTRKMVFFADGQTRPYKKLLSTLPLNRTLELTGLKTSGKSDPYTSVFVLNLGAERGPSCPSDHWAYVPACRCGFHRIGFYSNVDSSFLPASMRALPVVGMYVEKSFTGGKRLSSDEMHLLANRMIEELREWGIIGETMVADPTWIDVGYTWLYPGSTWVEEATALLEEHDIHSAGRYGRWSFNQGISESMRDGFLTGATLAPKDYSSDSPSYGALKALLRHAHA